jgi:hypothetical protein
MWRWPTRCQGIYLPPWGNVVLGFAVDLAVKLIALDSTLSSFLGSLWIPGQSTKTQLPNCPANRMRETGAPTRSLFDFSTDGLI